MKNILSRFWCDEVGAIVSAELVAVVTTAGLALTVGMAKVSQAISSELDDVACAISSVRQEFAYGDLQSCSAWWSGSRYSDRAQVEDVCSLYWREEHVHCPAHDPCAAPHGDHQHDGHVAHPSSDPDTNQ